MFMDGNREYKMAGNKLELKNRTVDTQEDKLDAPSSQRALSRSQQTLDRYINFIPTVAFPVTLQTSWEALSVSFGAGLLNGGPTALVWGLLLCLVGTLTIALSLAEMASITPVVGAQVSSIPSSTSFLLTGFH